jgi:hypothetical protein
MSAKLLDQVDEIIAWLQRAKDVGIEKAEQEEKEK